MIWSGGERNRSGSPPSRRSRGRIANLPLHQFEREESRLAIRGNPKNPICKEIALQRSKTGKFDYFSTPNQPARSRDSEFFTDDQVVRLELVAGQQVELDLREGNLFGIEHEAHALAAGRLRRVVEGEGHGTTYS